jgi:hypothetical protein
MLVCSFAKLNISKCGRFVVLIRQISNVNQRMEKWAIPKQQDFRLRFFYGFKSHR